MFSAVMFYSSRSFRIFTTFGRVKNVGAARFLENTRTKRIFLVGPEQDEEGVAVAVGSSEVGC